MVTPTLTSEQEPVYPTDTSAEEFTHIRKQKTFMVLKDTQELERGCLSKELEVSPNEAKELE